MNNQYEESICPVLDCFDIIRSHFLEIGDIIIRIFTVGCQSTGKSSVLENIIGIQLPRRAGTVTRWLIMI